MKRGFVRRLTPLAIVLAFAAAGCETLRSLIPSPPKRSMELVEDFEGGLGDDLSLESLETAAGRTIEYLSKIDQSARFDFGKRKASPAELISSIERLVEIFRSEDDSEKRSRTILRDFDVYRGTGVTKGGNVLVTGYYQPLLEGSRERDDVYRWPIYRKPEDIVKVDLGVFSEDLRGKRIAGRVEDGWLKPYYDRGEIDGGDALDGRGLEIVWVNDPVGLFILHVQGSGIVRLRSGEKIFINYADSNGRNYRSIGRLLIDEGAISREEMSLQAIRRWFEAHPDQLERVLYENPSYVFFREMEQGPFGATGVKLVAGRSAAFDPAMFPMGALAHIKLQVPEVSDDEITRWEEKERFILGHDKGGAIKGAGRVDLFFGAGVEAETAAGVMKNPGELFFLLLKPQALTRLKNF